MYTEPSRRKSEIKVFIKVIKFCIFNFHCSFFSQYFNKVCSLHFRQEDLRKSLAGRTYLVDECVPSTFGWSVPSPRKRKAPTERLPLPIPLSSKKHLFTSDSSSEINIASSAVKSLNEIFLIASGGNETNEPDISVESNVEMDQRKKVEDLEARLLRSEKELAILQKKNKELERKITENEQHQETMSSRLFCLDRFKCDTHVNFYTGLPNYATLITSFQFLNPGEDCENSRSRISSDIPEGFTTLNLMTRRMRRQPRKDTAKNLDLWRNFLLFCAA